MKRQRPHTRLYRFSLENMILDTSTPVKFQQKRHGTAQLAYEAQSKVCLLILGRRASKTRGQSIIIFSFSTGYEQINSNKNHATATNDFAPRTANTRPAPLPNPNTTRTAPSTSPSPTRRPQK